MAGHLHGPVVLPLVFASAAHMQRLVLDHEPAMGDDDAVRESSSLRQSAGRMLSCVRSLLQSRLQEVAAGSESTYRSVLASVLATVSQAVDADWSQIAELSRNRNESFQRLVEDGTPSLSQQESVEQLAAAVQPRSSTRRKQIGVLLNVLAAVFGGVGLEALGVASLRSSGATAAPDAIRNDPVAFAREIAEESGSILRHVLLLQGQSGDIDRLLASGSTPGVGSKRWGTPGSIPRPPSRPRAPPQRQGLGGMPGLRINTNVLDRKDSNVSQMTPGSGLGLGSPSAHLHRYRKAIAAVSGKPIRPSPRAKPMLRTLSATSMDPRESAAELIQFDPKSLVAVLTGR